MNLKQVSGKLVLHLIDHATRFSTTGVIPSKDRDVIISKMFQIWISIFGPPKQILSDNGGEFANEDFRIMAEKLNTTVRTTAESPWSNGINERHNAILENMVSKVMSDTGCSLDIAVPWAVASKNALANVYSYSPNQLVFGRNPTFPLTLIDKLPALETATHSDIVLKNLTAMRAARKAFIESEANERLRRAIRHQTRQSTPYIFQNGDSVYFKGDSSNEWKGPGTVIGVDNQTVLIKHGSVYVRVHPCRVLYENSEFLPDVDEGCIREEKLGSTELASWSAESETQTVGEDDEEVQNAQDNYDYEDESDDNNVIIEDAEDESDDNNVTVEDDAEDESGDNNVIVEGDTDESFGTRDNHYNDISNNENIKNFLQLCFLQ